MRTRCSLEAALLLLPVFLFAQVPENQEARERFRELLLGPLAQGAAAPAALIAQSRGQRVQFRTEAGEGALYYLFLNEEGSSFPIAGSGSWIIKRERADGQFLQAKVYFRSDPGCFLRLFPAGGRTSADVFLFGLQVDHKVLLPLAFTELLFQPFQRIRQLSEAVVRWDLLLYAGNPEADRHAASLLAGIRAALPGLRQAEDGAMDARGRYVRIADLSAQEASPGGGGLNCSGFAKWIVDGFVYPLTGSYLDITALKQRHLGLRGNRWSSRFEESRDPYFGLDWSRNLAMGLQTAAGFSGLGPEASDVRGLEYLRYRDDVGYSVEELPLALYLDTREHPGSLYLGSLSLEFGGDQALRQHYHLVVFLPYFTADGVFRVTAFDTGRESSEEEIRRRFAGHFIHLVRLDGSGEFRAPVAR
jgi:hypothetical protein